MAFAMLAGGMAQTIVPRTAAPKAAAKTAAAKSETAKHRPNLQVEFNKIQKAVDQCRCPELAAARASLMAVQNQMIQDTVELDAMHRAPAGDTEAADAQTPSPATHEPEPEPDSTVAPERAPLVTAPRAAIVLSGLALPVSLAAIFLWLRLGGQQRGWRRKEMELEDEITAQIDALDARVPKTITRTRKAPSTARALSRSGAQSGAQSGPRPGPQSGSSSLAKASASLPVKAAKAEEPAPESLPEAVVETERETATEPRRPPGDPLTDYQYATTLGEGTEEDWFREHYRCTGLSCVNLNDHRLGTEALYFQADPRGKFLLVEQSGQAEVLPGFGFDFAAGRGSFEGVFGYPPDGAGPLTLARSALVERTGERTGERWTLVQAGEFGRG